MFIGCIPRKVGALSKLCRSQDREGSGTRHWHRLCDYSVRMCQLSVHMCAHVPLHVPVYGVPDGMCSLGKPKAGGSLGNEGQGLSKLFRLSWNLGTDSRRGRVSMQTL